MIYRVEVPIAPPSLNVTMRRNGRYTTKKVKKDFRDFLSFVLRNTGLIGAKPKERVRVTFTRYSAGTLDDDNLPGAFKPVRDVLTELGVIANDDARHIEAHYAQVKAGRGVQWTRIEIETQGRA